MKLLLHDQNAWQNSWHRILETNKESQNTVTLSEIVGVKRLHFRSQYDTRLSF
jgi:hypothetical protein